MFGDQKFSPIYCKRRSLATAILFLALASVEIAFATSFNKLSLKEAAIPKACGKTVAFPARATPCNDSFHQLYCGISNRLTALLSNPNKEIFSSIVNCFSKSSTLLSIDKF